MRSEGSEVNNSLQRPFLIVVTGRPASGKTTLAHALASAIPCPALCRDEFKEGFLRTANQNHETLGDSANAAIYEAFSDAIGLMITSGISVVVEAAFQHKRWSSLLEPLRYRSRMTILVCTVNPILARARFVERLSANPSRTYFHGDNDAQMVAEYDPPRLPVPTISVDTSDGYRPNLAELVSFCLRSHSMPT